MFLCFLRTDFCFNFRELFGILDDLVLHETNEDFKKALSELQEDNIDSRFYVSEWRNCTDATGRSNMNYNNLQPGKF